VKKRRFIFLENGRGEKYFAVRREENARQTITLPCVLFLAHGKVFLKKTTLHFLRKWKRGKILCRAS
jgi:hypothetical protein